MESSTRMNKDRISDLPDPIIQHILSFLPSTKNSIQTCVLSKRWRNQWTRVPVLIFNCHGMSLENSLRFIDNVLIRHDCSKIHKFQIHYPYGYKGRDRQFAEKIAFATRKYVEELNLYCTKELLLPEFLFNNASLVKLRTEDCSFMPEGKVNWGCLSVLEIANCELPCEALENIVSGSPSLKSLKLIHCDLEKVVITSKSLKKLLISFCWDNIFVVEILCPNLEEFSLKGITTEDPKLLSQAIENVLSVSLLLESFKLCFCSVLGRLVIASKSLKKLVLNDVGSKSFDIEISCPQLEELKLIGHLDVNIVKLLDLSSSLCATIDFLRYVEQKTFKSMVIQVLQQLQYLKELKISTSFLEIVSTIKVGGRFSPLLSIQCLTLNAPFCLKHHSGIAYVLSISPMLEKLIIIVPPSMVYNWSIEKNYWDSNAVVFDCLVSHLKTIKIMGFPEEDGGRRKHLLNLVKFLLKNARVLEKMVVILKKDHIGTPFHLYIELSNLPRCSQKAIIEVVRF